MRISDWIQTCALPIWPRPESAGRAAERTARALTHHERIAHRHARVDDHAFHLLVFAHGVDDAFPAQPRIFVAAERHQVADQAVRSEERRGGKGGLRTSRSRWSADN